MDFFGLLPIIFIIYSVIKGISEGSKQKKKYNEARKIRPQNTKKRSIFEELQKSFQDFERDIKREINGKEYRVEKKQEIKKSDLYSDSLMNNVDEIKINKGLYKVDNDEGMSKEWKSNEFEDLEVSTTPDNNNSKSLVFSDNPFVQGLIMSEILGKPKSKRT